MSDLKNTRTPSNETLNEKIQSLKEDIQLTTQNTEWPPGSVDAAEDLMKTVKSCPTVPSYFPSVSHELKLALDKYIHVLEDVSTRVKDASSKPRKQQWKILARLKSMTSKHPSKCTLLFKTCQADLLASVNALNECTEKERDKTHDEPYEASSHGSLQLAPANDSQPPESIIMGTAAPALNQVPKLHGAQQTAYRGPVRQEMLNAARTTFKALDVASSSIPVAGNFTMDKNDDLAKDLGGQTARLLELLDKFNERSNAIEGHVTAERVQELQGELRDIQTKVTSWTLSGRFKKAFSAREQADALMEHRADIQTAQEEMQFLVSLDIHDMVVELKSAELQKEKRRLLKCLGDGKYGAQGNMLEDAVCFPGTRVAILDRVDRWIKDPSINNRVLWISGMAGRGKSTIASTVFHGWKTGASCAIFHFRRGQSALNPRVFCALARQLGESLDPEVKGAVLESVKRHEDIADKRLEEQFETLFVTPFSKLTNHSRPTLLIIDALDECNHTKDAIDFINLIHRHSSSLHPNIRFLLTSRPELPLVRTIGLRSWLTEDLELAPDASNDLDIFLQQKLLDIRQEHSIEESWPSSEDIARLVAMSQGLFQWARTAITYLGEGSPPARLRMLLKDPGKWSGLDELYQHILQKAFHNVRLEPTRKELLCSVLGALSVSPVPISLEVIAGLFGDQDIFEGVEPPDVIQFLRNDLLVDLSSLLFIPAVPTEPMQLMHTSVRDLMVSQTRCEGQIYYIDITQHHRRLATLCLRKMMSALKHNMCDLRHAWQLSSDIQDIVEQNLSRTTRYCCLAWSAHLTKGNDTQDAICTQQLTELKSFTEEKVLFWLEVMSLIGAISEAIRMVKGLRQWLLQQHLSQPPEFHLLVTLWSDVERLVTMFALPIAAGPLHIYTSALSFCPKETELWRCYGAYAPVKYLKGMSRKWDSTLWTRYVGSSVQAVAWSPDGEGIAVGTFGGSLQLFDPQYGEAISEPFDAHYRPVTTICFSPDGKLLASGSRSNIIRLWDSHSGEPIGEPLEGHDRSINSICFSPNGQFLASGSHDNTIRLWDPYSAKAVGIPLKGHDRSVTSICFSPDGKFLASGSHDNTVRLWDPHAWVPIGRPLEGHDGSVNSVAFSPDGKLIASGSRDMTIQFWDPHSGEAIDDPLYGHSQVLASASEDNTIRLWDTHSRSRIGQPLRGHNYRIISVCFSPNGKSLVSGSDDDTIRLWDTDSEDRTNESLMGHNHWISSVCFSPNGKLLASVSSNNTIQLWNTESGSPIGQALVGHSNWIAPVSFSPDGQLLASGSYDRTVRLWDAHSGEAIGEPLNSGEILSSVCFSPDGKLLASGTDEDDILLWDTHSRDVIGRLNPVGNHGEVTSLCFSPDGKLLASGFIDGFIQIWDDCHRYTTPASFYRGIEFYSLLPRLRASRRLEL
ncbi:hypothetical protein FRB90_001111 [Tulasnella sp. 427]|nr:hypothetical protein FRB90_001111 [Tulasnella sp. 427]